MSLHPTPSEFEARTNATYAALMWALSRPGLVRDLPGTGQAQIAEALIDRECAVHCNDPELAAHCARAGAQLVAPAEADHVFLDGAVTPGLVESLRCGSDLYPEDGATLIVDADLTSGAPLRLTGPGIDGALTVTVGGLPDGFWADRARAARYPMGFELFLLDGARVMGLPRSTKVEVR